MDPLPPDIPKLSVTEEAKPVRAAAIPLVPSPVYEGRILTEYDFEAAPVHRLTCEEVKQTISSDIDEFTKNIDFTPLHFIRDYLLHFEAEKNKNDKVTPAEAFASYNPNSANQALVEHGATCVGRSIDILKHLEEKYQLKGHVVMETERPDAPPTHAAAIIPCKDGVIFIDVMYDEKVCIIPYSTKEPISMRMSGEDRALYSFELVNMPMNLRAKEIILHKREELGGKTFQKQILLRSVQSVDQAVMKNFMLNKYSHVVYNDSPNMYIVYFEDHKVRCQVGRGKTALKPELPFSAFDPKTKTIDKSSLKEAEANAFLSDEFFKEMKTDKQTILDELFLFVKHYDTLKSLYESAGKPFKEQ